MGSMSTTSAKRSPATVADLMAIPEDERFHEVIDGELVRKAMPSGEHGDAQSSLVAKLKGPFQRKPGGEQPGGWWIYTEVEVELAPTHVYRPDIVGWRRERVAERPTGTPIRVRPDGAWHLVRPRPDSCAHASAVIFSPHGQLQAAVRAVAA